MTAAEPFQALGVTGPEESVYRLLLRHPGSTATQISQRLAIQPHSVRTALAGLERAGLVSRSPDAQPLFFPVAPDVGVEALILRRQADLEQARAVAKGLLADFHQGRRAQPPDLVEIVSGAEAVHNRFEQLQRGAKHLVQVLDAPPYAGPGGTPNRVEVEALARGVVYRGIYDRAALEAAPGTINAIARYVAAGEQARFLPRLPFKLATFDREFGYVPLAVSQPDIARFMVVRPCSLLDVLLYIFDTLWERATPITFGLGDLPDEHDPGSDPPAAHSRLLNLLATGMTDQAIAHHLGLSYRTARRRISALMSALGAESRFQAGVRASRRGWLLPARPAQLAALVARPSCHGPAAALGSGWKSPMVLPSGSRMYADQPMAGIGSLPWTTSPPCLRARPRTSSMSATPAIRTGLWCSSSRLTSAPLAPASSSSPARTSQYGSSPKRETSQPSVS